MQNVLLGILVLGLLVGLGYIFVRLDARTLAKLIRYVGGGLVTALGIGLALAGRVGFGLPIMVLGVAILSGRPLGRFSFGGLGNSQRSGGQASTVRSRFVEATLDHDSGEMTGTVLAGAFAGRALGDLAQDEVEAVLAEAAGDADSVALLEAYLDRRFPGWRVDAEDDLGAGAGRAADAGAMTDEEAYEILGLLPGAGEAEIRAAHRRLMKGVHPDQGGSTYLAARINRAKDQLLGRHR